METYTTYAYDGMNQALHREISPTVRIGRDSSDFIVTMQEELMDRSQPQGSMFSSEVSHARTTQWQETVTDWLATVERSGGSSIASLARDAPDGLSARMSLGSSAAEAVQTSQRSSTRSQNSGIASLGVCLTLNTSEWPKDGDACSLSEVLEEEAPRRFLLSPKACRGILNRAAKRGKTLPRPLADALEAVADSESTPNSTEE